MPGRPQCTPSISSGHRGEFAGHGPIASPSLPCRPACYRSRCASFGYTSACSRHRRQSSRGMAGYLQVAVFPCDRYRKRGVIPSRCRLLGTAARRRLQHPLRVPGHSSAECSGKRCVRWVGCTPGSARRHAETAHERLARASARGRAAAAQGGSARLASPAGHDRETRLATWRPRFASHLDRHGAAADRRGARATKRAIKCRSADAKS